MIEGFDILSLDEEDESNFLVVESSLFYEGINLNFVEEYDDVFYNDEYFLECEIGILVG